MGLIYVPRTIDILDLILNRGTADIRVKTGHILNFILNSKTLFQGYIKAKSSEYFGEKKAR